MAKVLAAYLLAWRRATTYAKDTNWIFARSGTKGKTPRIGTVLVHNYLYPAVLKAGVLTTTNIKAMRTKKKVDRNTAQTALGQSIVEFTLNKYTQTDNHELLAAQNLMLNAIFKPALQGVQ